MKLADIHRQICEMYGEYAMSDPMVRRWVRHFNDERKNVRDDPRSGRPSVVNEDLVRAVEEKIQENIRFTISSLSLHFFYKFHGHFFTKLCLMNFVVYIAGGIILQCRITKLVSRYNKCRDNGGNDVEKLCTVCIPNSNINGLNMSSCFSQ
jgi:hypothetical protein